MKKYIIIEVDGYLRSIIDTTGKANKYGQPKEFKTRKDAQAWIDRRTYKGMSYHYEIKEAEK